MAPLQSMNWFLSSIIAFASAIIASMGIGGGAVLLLFLTVFFRYTAGDGAGNEPLVFSARRGSSTAVSQKVRPFTSEKGGCLRPVGTARRFPRRMDCIPAGIYHPFQAVCAFFVLFGLENSFFQKC